MQVLVLYLATAIIFFAVDAVALRLLIKPLFERQIGDWLLESPRIGPAAVFYLFYVAGLLWLVSLPALRSGSAGQALVNGAILGAVAYGTYEFSNFATLTRWTWQQVAVDWVWGTVLTAGSAWAGLLIARSVAA